MKSRDWLVLLTAVCCLSCGGASTAPATAETADTPAEREQMDTAFGSHEEAAPEGAESAPAEETTGGGETPGEVPGDDETGEENTPDPDAPPPSADLNAYVGSGATTPEYQTVTANMDLIKRCYLDALDRNPDLQGLIKVQFTVNKQGKITKAKAIENELTPEVGKCVVKTMKKLKFPKRADSRTMEYPFKFFPAPSE